MHAKPAMKGMQKRLGQSHLDKVNSQSSYIDYSLQVDVRTGVYAGFECPHDCNKVETKVVALETKITGVRTGRAPIEAQTT